jgi:excinuclease UvrABC nuclease subunit
LEVSESHETYQTKYTELMQLLEETLDGNPKRLLQRIHDDIQQCITVENFERAAQLKEVYQ